MTTVLVVDDEAQMRRALTLNLGARDYTVLNVATGEAAMQSVATEHPDLVLLDLGLPGVGGLGVIHALRGWTTVPIIVLTARDDERSKVAALDAGADDYVTKPFGMAELLARINAALRRASDGNDAQPEITTSWLRIDLAAHRVFVGAAHDREVHLTGTEWQIVGYLVRNAGRLVTHAQLVAAVWGPGYSPNPNVLRVHVTNIRRKLEQHPAEPIHFVTDTGIGYRFEPDGHDPHEVRPAILDWIEQH
jgi:two-component system, OmpR family, KDP operon response regulator KdpE